MAFDHAATVDTETGIEEIEEKIRQDIPDDFRLVTILPDGGTVIERVYEDGKWEPIATFDHPNAAPEDAENFAEALGGGYRVVYDWAKNGTGEWMIEIEVDD